MKPNERYAYSEEIASIVDMADATCDGGRELIIADVVDLLNKLEAKIEALMEASNSLLGLIDCLGGGGSIDDAGPDRKTLAKMADYPNYMNKKLALLKGGVDASDTGK